MRTSLHWRHLLTLAWLCTLGTLPLQAQPGYEKFRPTPEYREATTMVQNWGTRAEGVERLLAIGRAHPQTTMGAQCLFEAATYAEDPARAQAIYEEVGRVYAGTAFAVHARNASFVLQNGEKPDDVIFTGEEQLLASLGAPTLAEIRQRPTQSRQRLSQMEENYREAIGYLYASHLRLLNALKRYDEAILIGALGRELFPHLKVGFDCLDELEMAYIKKFHIPMPLGESKIVPVSLKLNFQDQSQTGPRPLIRGTAFTGDFYSSSIDWQHAVVSLDGTDVRPSLNLICTFPKILKPGKVFEKIRFSYRPSQPLTPGRHVFYIKLTPSADRARGVVTERTLILNVRRDCEDERDDSEGELDRMHQEQSED